MILQPAKVAVPPDAALGLVVQASVPPGLVPRPRVMLFVPAEIGLPPTSSTLTAGWTVQAEPFAPPPGWVVKPNWLTAPIVMVKGVLVAGSGQSCGR